MPFSEKNGLLLEQKQNWLWQKEMLPGVDVLELRLACASFRFSQGFVFVTHVFAEPKLGTEHSTCDAALLKDCVRVQLTTMLL